MTERWKKWLTDPDAFLPGNNMEFHVPKAQGEETSSPGSNSADHHGPATI